MSTRRRQFKIIGLIALTMLAGLSLPYLDFAAIGADAVSIRSFTTDGCSAFPDGTPNQKNIWLDCCSEHDHAYWQGGTYAARMAADEALQVCVTGVGEPEIAALMLAGVRLGGTPYLPSKFRWGYGWGYFRGYQEPSVEELAQITGKSR